MSERGTITRSQPKKDRNKAAKLKDMATEVKLDALLAKLDEQEKTLKSILGKLEKLEEQQTQTANEVSDVKESLSNAEVRMADIEKNVRSRAKCDEVRELEKRDNLENRSKWNNVVKWGLREGAEHGKLQSIEEFRQEELFGKHMGLERIEVMRAHRTNIRTRMLSSGNRLGGPRPIHVYLFMYTDKVRILKAVPETLKGKKLLHG